MLYSFLHLRSLSMHRLEHLISADWPFRFLSFESCYGENTFYVMKSGCTIQLLPSLLYGAMIWYQVHPTTISIFSNSLTGFYQIMAKEIWYAKSSMSAHKIRSVEYMIGWCSFFKKLAKKLFKGKNCEECRKSPSASFFADGELFANQMFPDIDW